MTGFLCLATAIFFEAGVEPLGGKLAVANVIINRVEDERYPNDICSVVYDKNQFSFTHDGKSDELGDGPLAQQSLAAAEVAMMGLLPGITSTHYIADYASASWQESFDFDGKVGRHLFYTNNTPYR